MTKNTDETHSEDEFEAKTKDLLKNAVDNDLFNPDFIKAIFNMYTDKLPELFKALSSLVIEQRKATEHFANVDKESTVDYNDILNKQLDFLREQCKNAKTQEELDDLYKQFQDILDRLREEKHEQREYMGKLDKNQKDHTKFIAGLIATAATATLAIVFRGKINPPK